MNVNVVSRNSRVRASASQSQTNEDPAQFVLSPLYVAAAEARSLKKGAEAVAEHAGAEAAKDGAPDCARRCASQEPTTTGAPVVDDIAATTRDFTAGDSGGAVNKLEGDSRGARGRPRGAAYCPVLKKKNDKIARHRSEEIALASKK